VSLTVLPSTPLRPQGSTLTSTIPVSVDALAKVLLIGDATALLRNKKATATALLFTVRISILSLRPPFTLNIPWSFIFLSPEKKQDFCAIIRYMWVFVD
jgi:hypothetical protein